MTDLEEVLDTPHGDQPGALPAVPTALTKARRKTYNYRKIEGLETALADLHRAHLELTDRYAEVCADLEEARFQVANQQATVAAEQQTAEWAVETAWSARRELADHASGAVVAYVVIGALSIIAWEMLAHLVAAVTP